VADAGYLLKEHTTMPGEGNLEKLLQDMKPEKSAHTLVACNLP